MTIQVSSLSHMEWGVQPGIRPSSTEPSRHPSSSPHKPHRRQQSLPLLKQASLTASLSHGSMPPNTLEWKNTMDEVKRKYLARKYRSCSMQCCEILENLKETSAIEPLHRIYLHFYAASSFEWCARPLSPSTYRDELLRNSQTHYAQAEDLITAMEGNMTERASSPSWVTSPSSPSLSARSRTPDLSSTASSSPRTSAFFLDDPPTKPTRQSRMKSKKKVSFSSLPQLFEFQPEPYIRPDSPTLGWEDPFNTPNHEIDGPFPTSPKKHSSPISIIKTPLEEKKAPARIMTIAEFESRSTCNTSARSATASARRSCNIGPMVPDYDGERCSTPSNHTFDLEAFIQTRSLNRFRGQLSALRDQVCRHRAVVDNLLVSPETTPSASEPISAPNIKPSNPIPAVSHTRHQSTPMQTTISTQSSQPGNASRPALRIQTDIATNDAPTRYHHLRRYNSVSAGLGPVRGISSPVYVPSPRTPTPGMPASPLSAGGDVKNLQNRIERLRASGWQRKRFDNRRYEALREQVLGELEPCR